MAKAKESQAASFNPDEMSSGLKDDFRGKIVEAVFGPWDYDGNIEEPVLGVRITIEVEDEEEPVVQWWSAGDLSAFAPSKDGVEPCEEGEVGPYAVKVGKRTQLSGSTNFAHLMNAILDAGAASKTFSRENLSPNLECLHGIDAQWNRVPQKKRSGNIGQGEGGGKGKDVLVVTEIFAYGEEEEKPKGKTAKADAKPAPKGKAKEDEDTDDLDAEIGAAIVEALGENNGKLKKSKLPGIILAAFAKSPNKAAAVKRVTQTEFLSGSDLFAYDEDSGTVTEAE